MSIILQNISSLIHISGSGSDNIIYDTENVFINENENTNENTNENENDYKIGVLTLILIIWCSLIIGTIILTYCSLGLIVLYDYIKELIQKCNCNYNCNCKFKKKKIKIIPITQIVIDYNNNNNECSICLNEMNEPKETTKLIYCNHTFHSDCINNWINTCKNELKIITCPLCRSHIIFNRYY
jgi:hypothetical protein